MNEDELEKLLAEVRELLAGIDQDQIDSEQGWWETTDGAKFGAGRLDALEKLLRERLRKAS